jgi:cytoskeletal protein RodZ
VAPGPPDDFNDQPTQHAKYGRGGSLPPGANPAPPPTVEPDPVPPPTPTPDREQFEPPEFLDPLDEESEFTAWYRKPVVLIGWGLFVAILIGLIVYGIIELIHGNKGTSNNPSTSTTIPSTTTSTTPSQSLPPTTTTPTTAPPTSSTVQPPAYQPTQQQPTQQQPTHRHHLPQLPSVITIPEVPTVITVPPELR